MSEQIDYAEMLEIPVSTLNVTKKKSRKKREPDLKEQAVAAVNERAEGYEAHTEDALPPEAPAAEANVVDYGEGEEESDNSLCINIILMLCRFHWLRFNQECSCESF